MLITPSSKKRLTVEQFQGFYKKIQDWITRIKINGASKAPKNPI